MASGFKRKKTLSNKDNLTHNPTEEEKEAMDPDPIISTDCTFVLHWKTRGEWPEKKLQSGSTLLVESQKRCH